MFEYDFELNTGIFICNIQIDGFVSLKLVTESSQVGEVIGR